MARHNSYLLNDTRYVNPLYFFINPTGGKFAVQNERIILKVFSGHDVMFFVFSVFGVLFSSFLVFVAHVAVAIVLLM